MIELCDGGPPVSAKIIHQIFIHILIVQPDIHVSLTKIMQFYLHLMLRKRSCTCSNCNMQATIFIEILHICHVGNRSETLYLWRAHMRE